MTDTINVPRKLLERIIGKMNIVWQKTDETEELRTLLQAPAPQPPVQELPSVNQQLLEALEKVDSEHEILGRMKTCELRRGRGSFGIAVMSDELALDWQSHQKNLERLIGLRHAAIAAARQEGGKV